MRPESGDTRDSQDIRELVIGSSGKDAPCAIETPGGAGGRLDHILARELGLSLRGTRRFFEEHKILVNGRKAKPGMHVCPGDRVRMTPQERGGATRAVNQGADRGADKGAVAGPGPARLVMEDGYFAFFEKPALLHTQALAGRTNESVEKRIPALLPKSTFTRLLQRLDFETSGLLACALSGESVARFRALEARGQVEKRYLAVLAGRLEEPVVVQNRLAGRGKLVAALDFADPDRSRHTSFTPLMPLEKGASRTLFGHELEATLVGCVIHRGARHQIRAHAAQITHPLIYDALYGRISEDVPGNDAPHARHFLLHHARLSFAGYTLECLPAWLSNIPGGERQARNWFAQTPFMT